MQGIANYMELPVMLKADFSHVAVLQADLERRSKAINWAATGLEKALTNNLCTEEEAQTEMQRYLS